MEEKKSRISLDNKKIWVVGHNGMVGNSILKKLEKYKPNVLVTEKKRFRLKMSGKSFKLDEKKKARGDLFSRSKSWRNCR